MAKMDTDPAAYLRRDIVVAYDVDSKPMGEKSMNRDYLTKQQCDMQTINAHVKRIACCCTEANSVSLLLQAKADKDSDSIDACLLQLTHLRNLAERLRQYAMTEAASVIVAD